MNYMDFKIKKMDDIELGDASSLISLGLDNIDYFAVKLNKISK